ncbi:hypothetical protein [Frankia sp. Cas3]|nr:hypothetical protein [Frankia sp. Cas3]
MVCRTAFPTDRQRLAVVDPDAGELAISVLLGFQHRVLSWW